MNTRKWFWRGLGLEARLELTWAFFYLHTFAHLTTCHRLADTFLDTVLMSIFLSITIHRGQFTQQHFQFFPKNSYTPGGFEPGSRVTEEDAMPTSPWPRLVHHCWCVSHDADFGEKNRIFWQIRRIGFLSCPPTAATTTAASLTLPLLRRILFEF
jgi:hypothetical protein